MYRCSGKVNIDGTQPIVALKTIALHNVIALRVGSAKVALKMNIIHTFCSSRVALLRAPFSVSASRYLCGRALVLDTRSLELRSEPVSRAYYITAPRFEQPSCPCDYVRNVITLKAYSGLV